MPSDFSLRYKQQLPRSLARFQIPVRLLRLGKRIHVLNAQLELAVVNQVKHGPRAPLQIFRSKYIRSQRRPRQEKRPFLGQ